MGKILFCGICCLDIVCYVEHFPVEDGDYRDVEQAITLGGNATNSVKTAAQLNTHSALFSAIPDENPLFDRVFDEFRVNTAYCTRRPPSVKIPLSVNVVSLESGSRTNLHDGRGLTWPTAEDFRRRLADDMAEFSWFHFETIEEFGYAEMHKMIEHIRAGAPNARVSVELESGVPEEWLTTIISASDVIFMSKDFARLKGWTSMEEAVDGLQRHHNAEHAVVICAWAERGAAAKDPSSGGDAELVVVAGQAPSAGAVVDTLAAGDCFIGAAVHYLNEGALSLRQLLTHATYIAGESVGQRGLRNLRLPPRS